MSRIGNLSHSRTGRAIAGVLGLLLLLAPLSSCSGPSNPIATDPLQLVNLDLGIPTEALNSPVTGPLPDKTEMPVRITFKISPGLLKKAEQQKIEPGKSSHLEGIANQLGIDTATYQKIKSFFNVQGIALNLSKLRTHLAINGKASTFARVFHTKFVIHNYNGRTFYAPATPPQVPRFLLNTIDAVTGLDNYSSPPIHALSSFVPSGTQRPAQNCSPQDQTLLPREVAGAYGFDKLWNQGLRGENMTVNLVEIDGSYKNDIQNYFDCIQFKGKLSIVNIDGKPGEAAGESTLDIQMVAGLARSVNLVVYQTDGNTNGDIWAQVNDELQQILNDNVDKANAGSVVSISLGAAEKEITSNDMRAIDSSLQQLTRIEHMTVFVASGDCGAFTSRVYGDLSVSFPASDPWVTSVGGTLLSVNGNQGRVKEMVWADGSRRSKCNNAWGSGGGNSTVFKRPAWQDSAGVNNKFSRGNRQLPDVSAVAYALAVYFQGQWGAVGGTSAAAPIWATGVALVNQGLLQKIRKFDYSPQMFYQVANRSNGLRPYFDVTQGNNLYYPATSGWDYSTGLGTPNLADFYQILSTAP